MVYVLHRKSNCKKIKIRVVEGVVQVSAPFTVSKREIDRFVHEQEAWIENQLDKCALSKENDLISLLGNEYKLHYIDLRFKFFCEQLNIHDISLQYGFYKSKWGSCTPSKHKICFNVNLIFMPLEFVDAIILHELAHLYHLNHSKDFYNLLCTWMPNYKEIIKRYKKISIPNLY